MMAKQNQAKAGKRRRAGAQARQKEATGESVLKAVNDDTPIAALEGNDMESDPISDLPELLEAALAEMASGDQFIDSMRNAAQAAGCAMLFEIPAMLLQGKPGRAAAICHGETQELYFVMFDAQEGAIAVLASEDVDPNAIAFTRSYAGVLGMLAFDAEGASAPSA